MKQISRLRFDALAGYIREPQAALFGEELEWYSEGDERIVSAVIRDLDDDDFSAVLLGRDARGRFRAIEILPFVNSVIQVRIALEPAMRGWAVRSDADYHQGDERGRPIDLFTPVVPRDRFHPHFAQVWQDEQFSPAREIISAMAYYFEDPDGNFVEQFQTSGFDARTWELYLFASLHELGYAFDRSHPSPDYFCRGMSGELFIEAVTVNPTMTGGLSLESGPPEDPSERKLYKQEYMPIKYGSALFSKLNRKYWELTHVVGKPIVFAIQDFHFPGSMKWSEPSLAPYLYGRSFTPLHDSYGNLQIFSGPVGEHRWRNKSIPSGFFFLPGGEHVSAVLTNAQGTLTKFNRLGALAGFGSRRIRMVRHGTRYDPNPNASRPTPFVDEVTRAGYTEDWVEGMNVYHNPQAKIPLGPGMLEGAAHHFLRHDGQIRSLIPDGHPYGTETFIIFPRD
jgi:hypothetical protein